MRENPYVTSLDVPDSGLTEIGVRYLCEAMVTCPALAHANFSNYHGSGSWNEQRKDIARGVHVIEACERKPDLLVKIDRTPAEVFLALCGRLAAHDPELLHVQCHDGPTPDACPQQRDSPFGGSKLGWTLGEVGIARLVVAMRGNPHVEGLYLQGSFIPDSAVELICDVLPSCPRLSRLVMHSALSSSALALLVRAMKERPALCVEGVDERNFEKGHQIAAVLDRLRDQDPDLTVLRLHAYTVEADGSIPEKTEGGTSSKLFGRGSALGFNLGPFGLQMTTKALCGNPYLEEIDLRGSSYGIDDIVAVIEAALTCPRVHTIRFQETSLTPATATRVAMAIAQRPALQLHAFADEELDAGRKLADIVHRLQQQDPAVSYTHLTLPTKRIVEIS
eukprot:TRINITY_DN17934_c0_g1_i4.p1 TRINITY_DN17934_c0_g1~~TRINITY_DN17934_c0_g1_i4.p1  ORF type:complete len:392 (+),score=20.77 TRINITY_DN17934_c0_g1_i4:252-1427(+)